MALTAIQIPVNDLTGILFTRQSKYDFCRDFHYRFVQCAEAYGVRLSKKKCRDYYDDYNECQNRSKQLNRIWAMTAERERQWKAGKREEHFEPDPKHDIWNANLG